MTDSASGPRPRRLTARGAATKARIIEAADQLMYERGVASTTLADVRASSGTSKSQLYQHFAEKDALVKEVIEARAEALLSQQRRRLTRVESLRGLELWRDELVERNGLRNGAFGCPLGALANEIADHDEDTRKVIAAHFDAWLQLLTDAIEELKKRGVLIPSAEAHALATGGCWLLSKEVTYSLRRPETSVPCGWSSTWPSHRCVRTRRRVALCDCAAARSAAVSLSLVRGR